MLLCEFEINISDAVIVNCYLSVFLLSMVGSYARRVTSLSLFLVMSNKGIILITVIN